MAQDNDGFLVAEMKRVVDEANDLWHHDERERSVEGYEYALELAGEMSPETRERYADFIAFSESRLAQHSIIHGDYVGGLLRLERVDHELTNLQPGIRSSVLSLMAEAFKSLGNPDRAEPLIRRAVELSEIDMNDGGDDNLGAWFLAYLGMSSHYVSVARYEDARNLMKEFLSRVDWDRCRAKMGTLRTGWFRGHCYSQLGRSAFLATNGAPLDEDLRERLAEVTECLHEVLRGGDAEGVFQMQARGFLVRVAMRLQDWDRARAELALFRQGLARGDYGYLNPKDLMWTSALAAKLARHSGEGVEEARRELEDRFEAVLDDWRKNEREGGAGFLRYGSHQMSLGVLLSMSDDDQALEVAIRAQTWGMLWHELGRPEPDTRVVRERLTDDETGCLVVLPGEDRRLVLAFDRKRFSRVELPPDSWVYPRVERLRLLLRENPEGMSRDRVTRRARELDELSVELANELFPDSLRELVGHWRNVRIVGRDFVWDLAFEILPVFGGRPLGITHAISDVPSLPAAVAMAERPRAAGVDDGDLDLCVIVGSCLGQDVRGRYPGLEPIELDQQTLDELDETCDEVLVFEGERATRASLGAARSEGMDVLQIFAHGVQDYASELRPQMLLAPEEGTGDDGVLRVEEARELEVPEIVVLASCRTGDGFARIGDPGVSHFGGAFLLAGASCVVLSSEDQGLASARALSLEMYDGLHRGETVAEALRRAREALATSERFSDPHHWGFVRAYGLDVAAVP